MNQSSENQKPELPRIAISTGDPAGVGPEISLKAISDPQIRSICQPILFGDRDVLVKVGQQLNLEAPAECFHLDQWEQLENSTGPAICDFNSIATDEFEPGQINAKTGASSFSYFDRAIDLALKGMVDGIATGPIHKEALHLAGHAYPGHTEILADKCQTEDFCMLLTSEIISCSFVTTHVGYGEVIDLMDTDRILTTIRLTHQALTRFRKRSVRLICCGLNPHAGEGGLFGQQEEERFILPAIEQARAEGIDIEGPLPADTAFVERKRSVTDAYVCMYHDQGGIPLKALAFDEAVNVTLGLPIVRTSVDHGTARDIAWQGVAGHQSMIEAIKLAVDLSRN